MKFTVENLLLAAAIRPIASDLRKAALAAARKAVDLEYKEFDSPTIAYTAAERQAQEAAEAAEIQHLSKMKTFEQDWYADNPLSNFAKPALAELEKITAAISDS
jgi:hypothetical protein